jgi:hypothetical protein
MAKKKAKAKSKAKEKTKAKTTGKKSAAKKKAAKKSGAKAGKAIDFVEVRTAIAKQVVASAREIAEEVIKVALTGQLAPARYLFEAVGLYPATEETSGTAERREDSLAFTLLTRMGLPTEPVVSDEESGIVEPTFVKAVAAKAEREEREAAEESAGRNGDLEVEALERGT